MIGGGITNTSPTWYTIHLQGTNGTLAGPLLSSATANPYNLAVTLDAIAGVSNSWSIVGNNNSYLTNLTEAGNGSITFGTGSDSPYLAITNNQGLAALTVGDTTNTTAYFTMNSGTLALTNYNNAPLDLDGAAGGTGVFTLNGGNLFVAGKYLQIGDSGGTGIFNQNGGTVTTAISGDIILGNSINNSTGMVSIASGTFNTLANNDFYVMFRGNGTWNLSGNGLLEVSTLNFGRNNADSANASGTLNLNGGTLLMNHESMGNAATGQTGAINFNGGVLKASTTESSFITVPTLPSVLRTTVKAGGAIIDPAGFNVTISSPLVHDATLGASADGGLTVNDNTGLGMLTLTANNTYTGNTTITAGTLQLGAPSDVASLTTPLGTAAGTVFNSATLNFNSSQSVTVGNVITGTGILVVSNGTAVLTAVDTYSGCTYVRGGTLSLSGAGAIPDSVDPDIAAGATFDISGITPSGLTLTGSSPQQTLACSSSAGTAIVNAPSKTLTLAPGALLSFQAAGGASTTVGEISVAGAAANLALNNNAVTVNVTGAALAAGSYPLMSCGGTLTGVANPAPTIAGTPLSTGYTSAVSTVGGSGSVSLIVNATPVFSGLTNSQSINYGTASIILGGNVSSSAGPTTVYPANGDTVSATINGNPVNGTVNDSTGDFTITYPAATIPVGGPYPITYAYGGNRLGVSECRRQRCQHGVDCGVLWTRGLHESDEHHQLHPGEWDERNAERDERAVGRRLLPVAKPQRGAPVVPVDRGGNRRVERQRALHDHVHQRGDSRCPAAVLQAQQHQLCHALKSLPNS